MKSSSRTSSRTSWGSPSIITTTPVVILPLNAPLPVTSSKLSVPSNISITSGWSSSNVVVPSSTRTKSLSSHDVAGSDHRIGAQPPAAPVGLSRAASRTSYHGSDLHYRALPTLEESPFFGRRRTAASGPGTSSLKQRIAKATPSLERFKVSDLSEFGANTPARAEPMFGSGKQLNASGRLSDKDSREGGMPGSRDDVKQGSRPDTPERGHGVQFKPDTGLLSPSQERRSLDSGHFCFAAKTRRPTQALYHPSSSTGLAAHFADDQPTRVSSPIQQETLTATEPAPFAQFKTSQGGTPWRGPGSLSPTSGAFSLAATSKPETPSFRERPPTSDLFARSKETQFSIPTSPK